MVSLTHFKRVSMWLPVALFSCAAMVIVYATIQLFSVIFSASKAAVVSSSNNTSLASAPAADIGQLFGKTPSLLKTAEGGLLLRGIFMSETPQAGSAIIAARGKEPKLYVVGDRLPNGTTLVSVHEQQVVLEKAGEQSMLLLPQSHL